MRGNFNFYYKIGILLFTILSLSPNILRSQRFGKIEKSIVDQTVHSIDSTCDAAYILKKAKAYFDITPNDIMLVIDIHERIKIYNEEGERYADFAISLYRDGSSKEKVSSLKGVTFNSENGKLTSSRLQKSDIYTEEVTENRQYKKFAMPDVRPGSVIDVRYSIRTPYTFYIPRFDFQDEIPVDLAEYEVRVPSYYTYTPVPTGFVPIERSQKDVNGDYGRDMAFSFTAREVPALLDDDFVLDMDDYRSSIKYELYSAQFPNSETKYFVKDWNEIAKDLMKTKYFGKELKKKTKELKPFLNEIADLPDNEKIAAIYTHVQENYSWDGYYGVAKSEGVKNLIKNKVGNIGDINLLLINLLLQAGIDAKPFLLKGRNYGLLNQSYPSRTELNYLLAYIPDGDSFKLLDATSKYAPLGKLPYRATNINGLLIEGERGRIIDIPNPNVNKSITMTTYDIDTDEPSLFGSGKQVLKDYAAASYRYKADNKEEEEEEDQEEAYANEDDEEEEEEEISIENVLNITEVKNLEDINKDISTTFDESIYNEITKIGKQVFINATIDFGMSETPFFEEEREFPVFYRSLHDARQIITINIPDGYMVESLPESSIMALEGRTAEFKYTAKELGEKIIIDYTFKINKDFFVPEEYPNLKELYRRVVEKSKEKIIISPKT